MTLAAGDGVRWRSDCAAGEADAEAGPGAGVAGAEPPAEAAGAGSGERSAAEALAEVRRTSMRAADRSCGGEGVPEGDSGFWLWARSMSLWGQGRTSF